MEGMRFRRREELNEYMTEGDKEGGIDGISDRMKQR